MKEKIYEITIYQVGFEPIPKRYYIVGARPVDRSNSQRNNPNYSIIIFNIFKEKPLFRQSRERVHFGSC